MNKLSMAAQTVLDAALSPPPPEGVDLAYANPTVYEVAAALHAAADWIKGDEPWAAKSLHEIAQELESIHPQIPS